MVNKFKSLQEIVSDKNVVFGDLIMLRTIYSFTDGNISHDKPVFYGEIDNCISDGNAGFKKGKDFKGIRIFHYRRENGHFKADDDHTVFHHPKKGLLIPFNYENKYEYSLLMKSKDFPK